MHPHAYEEVYFIPALFSRILPEFAILKAREMRRVIIEQGPEWQENVPATINRSGGRGRRSFRGCLMRKEDRSRSHGITSTGNPIGH
jgi:hypothetical protein